MKKKNRQIAMTHTKVRTQSKQSETVAMASACKRLQITERRHEEQKLWTCLSVCVCYCTVFPKEMLSVTAVLYSVYCVYSVHTQATIEQMNRTYFMLNNNTNHNKPKSSQYRLQSNSIPYKYSCLLSSDSYPDEKLINCNNR